MVRLNDVMCMNTTIHIHYTANVIEDLEYILKIIPNPYLSKTRYDPLPEDRDNNKEVAKEGQQYYYSEQDALKQSYINIYTWCSKIFLCN